MIIGRKHIETRIVNNIETTKNEYIENIMNEDDFRELCEWVGELHDFQEVVYERFDETYIFLVDDVLAFLHDYLDNDCEDFQIIRANKYIKILEAYKSFIITQTL